MAGQLEPPDQAEAFAYVLSQGEVESLFVAMSGTHALMARLLYGTGMRLMECLRLRVKDVDFDLGEILIRDGKGAKDRVEYQGRHGDLTPHKNP